MNEYKYALSKSQKITRKVGFDFISNEVHWTSRGDTQEDCVNGLADLVAHAPIEDPINDAKAKVHQPTVYQGDPLPESLGMQNSVPACAQCGGAMEKKSGFSKAKNKNWAGWFCTNSTKENPHPVKWI